MQKFVEVTRAHGGDPRVLENPDLLPQAQYHEELLAPRSGYVTTCDALSIGVAAMRLGAGRERKEDIIDPAVGITLLVKPGESVEEHQPLARISFNDASRLAVARPLLEQAFAIETIPVDRTPLILGEVRS